MFIAHYFRLRFAQCDGAGEFIGGISVMSSQAIDKEGKTIWKASKPAICEGEGE